MSALAVSEIVPGVVARIDTQLLRSIGGAETNAQVTDAEDRAVKDERDFLVVAVDAAKGVCTCLPLFGRSSPGSAPLVVEKRSGTAGSWRTDIAHYSRWQHWRVPLAAFAAASQGEESNEGDRRGYAVGDADTLQDLANWATRNRCVFRPA